MLASVVLGRRPPEPLRGERDRRAQHHVQRAAGVLRADGRAGTSGRPRGPAGELPVFGQNSAKCCSFAAVSAPIFASKYAFCSNCQNLPDYLAEFF